MGEKCERGQTFLLFEKGGKWPSEAIETSLVRFNKNNSLKVKRFGYNIFLIFNLKSHENKWAILINPD